VIPLSHGANEALAKLARHTGSAAIAAIDGATLLGERAMLANRRIPGRVSAGGGCRLFEALDDTVALNLARAADRELLAALFQAEDLDAFDDRAIAACIARSHAATLVDRGRSMGLAIAAERECLPAAATLYTRLVEGLPSVAVARLAPKVLDLSSLWAGPLAAHLLWLAGADVVKVESRTRPDAMREGEPAFHALLNQGKASVVLDFADAGDRRALMSLIAASDIVIEASRPRALAQLGLHAEHCVRSSPGLVWVSITGHGADGESAGWVGFGDDCGVAGGLSAALRAASGRSGFVGDAIADPLTGISAALVAWDAWKSGRGGRFGVALSRMVAYYLAAARARDPAAMERELKRWSAAEGQPFGAVRRRRTAALANFGEDTRSHLARVASC
jgi:CoA transferase family III